VRATVLALLAAGCVSPDRAPGPFALTLPASGASVLPESLTFSWSPSESAQQYTLTVSADDNFDAPIVSTSADPSIRFGPAELAQLQAGGRYVWKVTADGVGPTLTASNAPFRFELAPAAPDAFMQTSPAPDSDGVELRPTLSWTAAGGAARFAVEVATDAAFTPPLVWTAPSLAPSTNVVTLPDSLVPGTRYFWRVTAWKEERATFASNAPLSFTTGPAPADFSLVAPAPGMSSVSLLPTLRWTASDHAAVYTVALGTDSSLDAPALSVELLGEVTSLALTSPLAPSTPYFWRVVATNARGSREASASFVTGATPGPFDLLSPPAFQIEAPLNMALEWSPSADAVSYRVQLGTDRALTPPLVFEDLAVPASTTRVALPLPLMPGGSYYWSVTAVNALGEMPANGAPAAFIAAPPPSPFNEYFPWGGTGFPVEVTFSWEMTAPVTSFIVDVSRDSTFATIDFESPPLPPVTSYTVPLSAGLLGLTKYAWRVTAVGPGGSTVASQAYTFTTGAIAAPFDLLTPADGAIDVPTDSTLTWSDSTGEDSYILQISTDPTFAGPLVMYQQLSTRPLFPLIASCPLARSTRYFWRVLAVAQGGTRPPRNGPASFTTASVGSGGGLEWVVERKSQTAPQVGHAFVVDGTGLYTAGTADGAVVLEKRSLSDGALLWEQPLSVNPVTLVRLALDSTGVYAAATDGVPPASSIRVEKRSLTTGALVSSFGTAGALDSRPPQQGAFASDVVVGDGALYVGGLLGNGFSWLEKRSPTTGAPDLGFGGDGGFGWLGGGGFVTLALTPHWLLEQDISVSSSAWTISTRQLDTGAVDAGFGAGGTTLLDPNVFYGSVLPILSDSSATYFSGTNYTLDVFGNPSHGVWWFEKRSLIDGQSVSDFNDGGLVVHDVDYNQDNFLNGAAVDATTMFGVGQYASGDSYVWNLGPWHLDAIDTSSGQELPSWPTDGVFCATSQAASQPYAVTSDGTHFYVLGVEPAGSGYRWRIEKRQK
jgi:hypothetical protein